MTAFPLSHVTRFLLSCEVTLRRVTVDVLNFGMFISKATTAPVVIAANRRPHRRAMGAAAERQVWIRNFRMSLLTFGELCDATGRLAVPATSCPGESPHTSKCLMWRVNGKKRKKKKQFPLQFCKIWFLQIPRNTTLHFLQYVWLFFKIDIFPYFQFVISVCVFPFTIKGE